MDKKPKSSKGKGAASSRQAQLAQAYAPSLSAGSSRQQGQRKGPGPKKGVAHGRRSSASASDPNPGRRSVPSVGGYDSDVEYDALFDKVDKICEQPDHSVGGEPMSGSPKRKSGPVPPRYETDEDYVDFDIGLGCTTMIEELAGRDSPPEDAASVAAWMYDEPMLKDAGGADGSTPRVDADESCDTGANYPNMLKDVGDTGARSFLKKPAPRADAIEPRVTEEKYPSLLLNVGDAAMLSADDGEVNDAAMVEFGRPGSFAPDADFAPGVATNKSYDTDMHYAGLMEEVGRAGGTQHNGRPVPGVATDETYDGEMDDGETYDGEMDDGETYDGEMDDGETYAGEMDDGEMGDGETYDGETYDGEMDDGEIDDATIMEARGRSDVLPNGNYRSYDTNMYYEGLMEEHGTVGAQHNGRFAPDVDAYGGAGGTQHNGRPVPGVAADETYDGEIYAGEIDDVTIMENRGRANMLPNGNYRSYDTSMYYPGLMGEHGTVGAQYNGRPVSGVNAHGRRGESRADYAASRADYAAVVEQLKGGGEVGIDYQALVEQLQLDLVPDESFALGVDADETYDAELNDPVVLEEFDDGNAFNFGDGNFDGFHGNDDGFHRPRAASEPGMRREPRPRVRKACKSSDRAGSMAKKTAVAKKGNGPYRPTPAQKQAELVRLYGSGIKSRPSKMRKMKKARAASRGQSNPNGWPPMQSQDYVPRGRSRIGADPTNTLVDLADTFVRSKPPNGAMRRPATAPVSSRKNSPRKPTKTVSDIYGSGRKPETGRNRSPRKSSPSKAYSPRKPTKTASDVYGSGRKPETGRKRSPRKAQPSSRRTNRVPSPVKSPRKKGSSPSPVKNSKKAGRSHSPVKNSKKTGRSPAPVKSPRKTSHSPVKNPKKSGGSPSPVKNQKNTGGPPSPVKNQKNTGGSPSPVKNKNTGRSPSPVKTPQKTGSAPATMNYLKQTSSSSARAKLPKDTGFRSNSAPVKNVGPKANTGKFQAKTSKPSTIGVDSVRPKTSKPSTIGVDSVRPKTSKPSTIETDSVPQHNYVRLNKPTISHNLKRINRKREWKPNPHPNLADLEMVHPDVYSVLADQYYPGAKIAINRNDDLPIYAPAARRSAPSARRSAPSAPRSAPSAPRSAPSAPRSAPSAPRSAPSAPRSAPSAPRSAPSKPATSSRAQNQVRAETNPKRPSFAGNNLSRPKKVPISPVKKSPSNNKKHVSFAKPLAGECDAMDSKAPTNADKAGDKDTPPTPTGAPKKDAKAGDTGASKKGAPKPRPPPKSIPAEIALFGQRLITMQQFETEHPSIRKRRRLSNATMVHEIPCGMNDPPGTAAETASYGTQGRPTVETPTTPNNPISSSALVKPAQTIPPTNSNPNNSTPNSSQGKPKPNSKPSSSPRESISRGSRESVPNSARDDIPNSARDSIQTVANDSSEESSTVDMSTVRLNVPPSNTAASNCETGAGGNTAKLPISRESVPNSARDSIPNSARDSIQTVANDSSEESSTVDMSTVRLNVPPSNTAASNYETGAGGNLAKSRELSPPCKSSVNQSKTGDDRNVTVSKEVSPPCSVSESQSVADDVSNRTGPSDWSKAHPDGFMTDSEELSPPRASNRVPAAGRDTAFPRRSSERLTASLRKNPPCKNFDPPRIKPWDDVPQKSKIPTQTEHKRRPTIKSFLKEPVELVNRRPKMERNMLRKINDPCGQSTLESTGYFTDNSKSGPLRGRSTQECQSDDGHTLTSESWEMSLTKSEEKVVTDGEAAIVRSSTTCSKRFSKTTKSRTSEGNSSRQVANDSGADAMTPKSVPTHSKDWEPDSTFKVAPSNRSTPKPDAGQSSSDSEPSNFTDMSDSEVPGQTRRVPGYIKKRRKAELDKIRRRMRKVYLDLKSDSSDNDDRARPNTVCGGESYRAATNGRRRSSTQTGYRPSSCGKRRSKSIHGKRMDYLLQKVALLEQAYGPLYGKNRPKASLPRPVPTNPKSPIAIPDMLEKNIPSFYTKEERDRIKGERWSEYMKLTSTNRLYAQQHEDMRLEITDLRVELDQANDRADVAEHSVHLLTKDLDKYTVKNKELEDEARNDRLKLASETEAFNKFKEQLTKECDEHLKAKESMEATLQKTVEAAEKKKEAEMQELFAKEREELEAAKVEAERKAKSMQEACDSVRSDCAEQTNRSENRLSAAMKECNDTVKHYNEKLERLMAEANAREVELIKSQNVVERLTKCNSDIVSSNQEVQFTMDTLDEKLQLLDENRISLETKVAQGDEQIKELMQLLDDANAHCGSVENERNVAEQALEAARAEYDSFMETAQGLAKDNEERTKQVSSLKQKLKKSKNDKLHMLSDHNEKMDHMLSVHNEQVDLLEKLVSTLKEKSDTAESQLVEQQGKINTLELLQKQADENKAGQEAIAREREREMDSLKADLKRTHEESNQLNADMESLARKIGDTSLFIGHSNQQPLSRDGVSSSTALFSKAMSDMSGITTELATLKGARVAITSEDLEKVKKERDRIQSELHQASEQNKVFAEQVNTLSVRLSASMVVEEQVAVSSSNMAELQQTLEQMEREKDRVLGQLSQRERENKYYRKTLGIDTNSPLSPTRLPPIVRSASAPVPAAAAYSLPHLATAASAPALTSTPMPPPTARSTCDHVKEFEMLNGKIISLQKDLFARDQRLVAMKQEHSASKETSRAKREKLIHHIKQSTKENRLFCLLQVDFQYLLQTCLDGLNTVSQFVGVEETSQMKETLSCMKGILASLSDDLGIKELKDLGGKRFSARVWATLDEVFRREAAPSQTALETNAIVPVLKFHEKMGDLLDIMSHTSDVAVRSLSASNERVVSELRDENDMLTRNVDDLEARMATILNKCTHMAKQVEHSKEQEGKSERILKKERQEHATQLKALELSAQSQQDEASKRQAYLQQFYEKKIDSERDGRAKDKSDVQSMTKKIADLKIELADKMKDSALLATAHWSQLEGLRDERDAAKLVKAQAEKDFDKKVIEVKQNFDAEIKEKSDEIHKLTIQLREKKDKIDELESTVRNHSVDLENSKLAHFKLINLHEGKSLDSKQKVERLQEKISNLEQAMLKDKHRVKQMLSERTGIDLNSVDLAKKVPELKVKQLEKQVESADEVHRNDMTRLKADLKIEEDERLQAQKYQFQEVQAQLLDARSKLDAQRVELEDQDHIIRKYRSQVSAMQTDTNMKDNQLKDSYRKYHHLKANSQSEVNKVKLSLEGRLAVLTPLPEILKNTELKLQQTSERAFQYEKRHTENAQTIADLTAQADRQNREINTLKEKCNAAEASLRNKMDTQAMSEAEKQNHELLKSVVLKDEALNSTTLKLEEQMRVNSSLSQQLQQALASSQRTTEEVKDKLLTKEKCLQQKARDLEDSLNQARTDLSRQRREKDEVERKLTSRMHDLRDRLEQSHATNRSMQNYVQLLKGSFSTVFTTAPPPPPSLPNMPPGLDSPSVGWSSPVQSSSFTRSPAQSSSFTRSGAGYNL